MNTTTCILALPAALLGWAALAGPFQPDVLAAEPVKIAVEPVVRLQARPFRLQDVRLLPGPLRHAMEMDQWYLLSLDVDRLLHNFRVTAGVPSSSRPYGGWEEPTGELRGCFVGHYLSAVALMYASTGDERFRSKGDAIVAGLAECQARLGNGYLSGFPEEHFDRLEAFKRVWAPYYGLHKIYAGLLDMYMHCGNRQALDTCRSFADWAIARNTKFDEEQMQRLLGNEHGGMNEVLAELYALTGEKRYLEAAERFNHMAVLGPAAKRQDTLTSLHANTQIPKFIGAARQYELTGKPWQREASAFFWDTVVKERSYVIGGNSDQELFLPKERLSQALGVNTTETCNTYNMLKLTRHLFSWDPKAEYADYYERALYNHILGSQNPDTGMMCYYVPLRSGSRKEYNTPLASFWCCTGTGVENHAKYGDSIYFHDDNTLWVNLFIASELDWKAKNLKLRQETPYPGEGASKLVFSAAKPVEVSLKIRRPWWATTQFEITVNGTVAAVQSTPGSYVTLSRTWRNGDVVEIAMPFCLRAEAFADNPRRIAFMNGPLVLAAEVDLANPIPGVVTGTGSRATDFLKPVAGKASTFTAANGVFRFAGENPGPAVTLEPFYKIHHHRRYVVYWDRITPAEWALKEDEHRTAPMRARDLESRTVDRVDMTEVPGKSHHNVTGERTGTGVFNDRRFRQAPHDVTNESIGAVSFTLRPFRQASNGGWFSYTLRVVPDQPQELHVTYWGGDHNEAPWFEKEGGDREFDVIVEGRKVGSESLRFNNPWEYYDQVYRLPADLTKSRTDVTVKFQAHPGRMTGRVFGCAIVSSGQ